MSAERELVLQRLEQVLNRAHLRPSDVDRVFHYTKGYFGKIVRGEKPLQERHIAEVASLTRTNAEWIRSGKGPERAPEPETEYPALKPGMTYCPTCGQKIPEPIRKGDVMKRIVLLAVCFLALGAGSQLIRPTPVESADLADQKVFRVTRVIDGDTIRIGPDAIRLVGIQAPEEAAPFGPEATAWLVNLLEGEQVYLVQKEDEERDAYNRRLCYVYRVPDRLFVNFEAIRQGYAKSYRRFPCRFTQEFNAWESYAKQLRKGLWKKATTKEA